MRLTFTEGLSPSEEPLVVTLSVDASPGCGGIVWPAGQILSNYLVRTLRSFLQGKTVLELGSGTGLVGIVAAKLGAKVYVTDQAPLLDIMRRNVLRNNLASSCTVSELNWGEPTPADIPAPDVVLAADCVYFEPAFPLLVQTLCDIYENKPEILFCYKKRRKADKRFFAILKKSFSWEQVILCC
ncbi:S-adenosyl-L-methionine-dependent methyltransferase [Guyanagaster necrorhizus]|uniref:S-adenosyl-L-methionine-dependent methyltransferase n=1 Tax=Guyanagaster necrorhizus TaxID=856835 RepID=A0A9P7VXV2_9AGAR|nr:S-adenosyl-L-methionine-dependent methyltransferase [Guyanagaster necrorhizus MCA 3950]KAG7448922.1 S-adenosyl-L-methionine-dependent methyltransferase [Guyanagaster necrorhizus MCA 3950]